MEETGHIAEEVTLVSCLGVLQTYEFYNSNQHLKLASQPTTLHNYHQVVFFEQIAALKLDYGGTSKETGWMKSS